MKTEVIKVDKKHPDPEKLRRAAEVLKNGGVIVIPTDTVYGLACNAFDAAAQRRIYTLKGRSYRKPLIVMPPDVGALRTIAAVPPRVERMVHEFWPGPLTLVLNATDIGKMVMGGRDNLGARIPDSPVVIKLLKLCGFPLLTTSANPSSRESATSGAEAKRYFMDQLELIIDAGPAEIGAPSTVVDLTHFHGVVVREGCLSSKELLPYLV